MRTVLIFLIVPFLFAFKFNPMSQSLDLGDGKKSSQFTVENDTDMSMAIELTVKERKMDIVGNEELPDTSELSIFPPQIIIPPKEKRTVRVSWNGPGDLKSERAFRVVAEQLKVNVDEKARKQTGIEIMMKYMAAFYVAPKDIESKISIKIDSSEEAKKLLIDNERSKYELAYKEVPPAKRPPFTYRPVLVVRVANEGSKHQVLLNPKLTFRKDSKKWVFEEKDLQGLAGENVLANEERIFDIKLNKNVPSDAEVSLKIED